MSFEILFVLCLGIAFTPWIGVKCSEYDSLSPILQSNLDEYVNNQSEVDNFVERAGLECSIKINGDLKEPQPLFMLPNSVDFYNPDKAGTVHIPNGAEIEFYCTKGFANNTLLNYKSIIAKCQGAKTFKLTSGIFNFDNLLCKKPNEYISRRTNRKCHNNAIVGEIGFLINNNKFASLMEVCHDEQKMATYYVKHQLSPFNGQFQRNVERPWFQKGPFFKNRDVNKWYTQKEQIKTVGKILGGDHLKYFDLNNYIYMARGHLSAKADYVFGIQQLGTFFYINVAPQWQTFNAGNWQSIEESVRNFVSKRNIFADLYTGTWGIGSLRDRNGKFREIYLYSNLNDKQIPVPKLYYKIIIDRKTRNGIVLIGVNNPHLTLEDIKLDYIICNDISDKINWINWKKDDIKRGYSYACTVPDFIKTVNHLPKLNVNGILL